MGGGGLDEKVLKARAFFEKNYSPELKTRVEIDEPLQAYLSSLDLVPDWEYAAFSENEEESYLEVPLLSIPKIGFGPPEAEEDEILLSDQRLVVREIKETGEMYLYTSLWIPADTPSLIAMPSLTMFDKGQFTGVVYFFTLDGLFYWGAGFQDGEALTSEFIVSEEEIAPSTRSTLINSKPGQFCEPIYWYWYTCVNCSRHPKDISKEDAPNECDCRITDTSIIGYSCTGGGDNGSGDDGTLPTPTVGDRDDGDDKTKYYTITVSANPTNGGHVSGTGSYTIGTTVTITATAYPGFEFVNWSNGGSSDATLHSPSSSMSITVREDASYVAMFADKDSNVGDKDPCSDLANDKANPLVDMKLAPPSKWNTAGATYGDTRYYSNGSSKFHNGIDLAGPVGTPIYSMFNGTVGNIVSGQPNRVNGNYPAGYSGDDNDAGNRVSITTSTFRGLVTVSYWHLQAGNPIGINRRTGRPWAEGDEIYAGEIIEYIGISGNAGAAVPHLHLNTKVNGKNVNPTDYLNATIDPTTTTITTPCD